MSTHPHTHAVEHHHEELGFLRKYIFSEDHKIIGIQFLFSGVLFLLLGGALALLVRIQLGWPHAEIPILGKLWWPGSAGGRMPPEVYNMLFSMHASVMIFFVIIPLLVGSVRQLYHSAHDRRQGHGVPQAEHDVVLVHVARVHYDSGELLC